MSQTISFIIPSVFLYIYMILSSIEFGVSFFQIFPDVLSNKKSIKSYINPVWEITNVFLVFFIVSIVAFFPKANFALGTDLLPVLFTGLIFFGIRVAGMLFIFYSDAESKLVNALFFIGCFCGPVVFSLFFVYALAGQWSGLVFAPLVLSLACIVIGTIMLISSTFFRYFGREVKNASLNNVVRVSMAWTLFSFLIFYSLLFLYVPYLMSSSLVDVLLIFAVLLWAICFGLMEWSAAEGRKLFRSFVASCIFVGLMFFPLMLMHLPYIVYPQLTVFNAFTEPAVFNLLITGFIIGMIIIIPSLYLLYYLFIGSSREGANLN